ncbi:hypothetical protein VKT23_011892 [Stygiomarasmius scandens]|uniref:Uncharacterized protein n=1 Tax=Marasmiellus scandens TaxID=2682957 RepID=A0ABR1J787_9AGAR
MDNFDNLIPTGFDMMAELNAFHGTSSTSASAPASTSTSKPSSAPTKSPVTAKPKASQTMVLMKFSVVEGRILTLEGLVKDLQTAEEESAKKLKAKEDENVKLKKICVELGKQMKEMNDEMAKMKANQEEMEKRMKELDVDCSQMVEIVMKELETRGVKWAIEEDSEDEKFLASEDAYSSNSLKELVCWAFTTFMGATSLKPRGISCRLPCRWRVMACQPSNSREVPALLME